MKIDNRTKLYISAASAPGNLGAAVYNELFKKFGMNCVYIPRTFVDAGRLAETIRALDIKGCSVSMPLKSAVVKFLDRLDGAAEITGSVNTIVNDKGSLTGYDTDWYGVRQVLRKIRKGPVVIYGSGSVVNSVVFALKKLKFRDITITARDFRKAVLSAKKNGVKAEEIRTVKARRTLLVNATPAGAKNKDPRLFALLGLVSAVLDLVVAPDDTALAAEAERMGLRTIRGIEMSEYRIQRQFEIYSGSRPDIGDIDSIVRRVYLEH
ncbi:MAG: hypothetical protein WCW52_00940 [Elusimicrobiales bacterium]|jgi:shikimate dehydrogenase